MCRDAPLARLIIPSRINNKHPSKPPCVSHPNCFDRNKRGTARASRRPSNWTHLTSFGTFLCQDRKVSKEKRKREKRQKSKAEEYDTLIQLYYILVIFYAVRYAPWQMLNNANAQSLDKKLWAFCLSSKATYNTVAYTYFNWQLLKIALQVICGIFLRRFLLSFD